MTPTQAYKQIFDHKPHRVVGRRAEDARKRHAATVDEWGIIGATVNGITYYGLDARELRRQVLRVIELGIPQPVLDPPQKARSVLLSLRGAVRQALAGIRQRHGLDTETGTISLALAVGIARLGHLRPDTVQRLADAAPELSADDALDAATDIGVAAIVAHYARAQAVAVATGLPVAEVWAQAVDLGLDALEQCGVEP